MEKPLLINRNYNILKIVGIYAVFGFLWIYTSDTVLELFVLDPKITTQIAIFKGSAFIIITSLLLYILIKLYDKKTINSEQVAIASAKRFEALFQKVADSIFITDTKGKIIAANDQSCRELGYTLEEILRLHMSEVDASAGADDIFAANLFLLANNAITFETNHRRKDGSVFPVELNVCLIDLAGQQAVMGVARNITERKHAEQELRQSHELMSYIIKHNTSALAVHDKELKYLFVSERYLDDYKVKDKDVIGKHHYDVFPDLPQKWRDIHQMALAGITSKAENDRYDKEDGSVEWTTWECRPWHEANGEVGGFVLYTEVVTDRIKAEEQKLLLLQQLHQAQKMEAIGTLAGGIAHDFNNILGGIIGYTELAIDSLPPESMVIEYLNKVQGASYRASGLVKQILAFSRQSATDRIPLVPTALVMEAIKLLRQVLPSTILIKLQLDSDTGLILADPTQIHQIVMNLCTNSFHAMEHTGGNLNISLRNSELSPQNLQSQPHVLPGWYVELSVSDSGPGIAPEIKDRIFDPFFTTKEIGKGTGMGLAITHGIVTSYGGFITCESEPGNGTVFHVFFPVIEQNISPVSKVVETTPSGKERILFVDDEEMLANLGKTMLEPLGYEVTIQTSSLEALHAFQSQPDQFDAVITDLTMSGMTGIDLARRMLQIRPELPIILCTGYSSLISEEKARSLGIKGFAMKPIARKDIATLLRRVLDGGLPA